MKILLTGRVGVGKSTLIARLLDSLGVAYGGFRTERIGAGSGRAYRIVDLMTGEGAPIAEAEGGRLRSHPQAFEGLGARAIRRALDSPEIKLIVMDELGLLEEEAHHFQAAVLEALQGGKPVLGVVKAERSGFLDRVRALPGVELIEVTEGNRSSLFGELRIRLSLALERAADYKGR